MIVPVRDREGLLIVISSADGIVEDEKVRYKRTTGI